MRGLYILRSSTPAASSGTPVNTSAGVKLTATNAAPPVPPPSAGQKYHNHDFPHHRPAFAATASILVQPETSALSIRPRQVTDPLTETVRARLCGSPATVNYSSSGSQHDPSSVCLAAMVNEFLEEEINTGHESSGCGMARCNCVDGVCSGEGCDAEASPDFNDGSDDAKISQFCEILEGVTSCTSNPELLLLVDVVRALESETEELRPMEAEEDNYSGDDAVAMSRLRRPVMKRLREEGYNAAVCKSRWSHSEGLPAGDYEYIDVLISNPGDDKSTERFIVDIDFRAQFEIARASRAYRKLLGSLPRVFVGRAERLKQILKIMSDASKRSLRAQGLLMPPWRKHRYLQAKWFSAYRRTTNDVSKSSSAPATQQYEPGRAANNIALKEQGPNMFDNLQFTKEMDMIFFNAHGRANIVRQELINTRSRSRTSGRSSNRRIVSIHSSGIGAAVAGGFGGPVGVGVRVNNYNRSSERPVCTVTSTDWQLPSVDMNSISKPNKETNRVSGLSSALKTSSSSSSNMLVMVSS